ncbi:MULTISPECIES: hypothetical protein [unclassified Microcoleus]|uniref:hypothetical protein n=1 Tax=unclassified Microcoleus TaxID=2642155 RepID=UPI002FD3C24A
MFGFIKNFFGGIFGFFGRLLGLKKSEYFLDLGESGAKEPAKVAPAKAEPVAIAPAKVESEKSVKSEKSEPAKKAKVEKKSQKEKEPVASVPANTAEPAKVPAVAATNGKVPSQAEPNRTFAPNNLMPTSNATRRGPGPSMNNFREMARQVKTK